MIIMCIILFTVYPFKLIGHLIEHSLKEIAIEFSCLLKFLSLVISYAGEIIHLLLKFRKIQMNIMPILQWCLCVCKLLSKYARKQQ